MVLLGPALSRSGSIRAISGHWPARGYPQHHPGQAGLSTADPEVRLRLIEALRGAIKPDAVTRGDAR